MLTQKMSNWVAGSRQPQMYRLLLRDADKESFVFGAIEVATCQHSRPLKRVALILHRMVCSEATDQEFVPSYTSPELHMEVLDGMPGWVCEHARAQAGRWRRAFEAEGVHAHGIGVDLPELPAPAVLNVMSYLVESGPFLALEARPRERLLVSLFNTAASSSSACAARPHGDDDHEDAADEETDMNAREHNRSLDSSDVSTRQKAAEPGPETDTRNLIACSQVCRSWADVSKHDALWLAHLARLPSHDWRPVHAGVLLQALALGGATEAHSLRDLLFIVRLEESRRRDIVASSAEEEEDREAISWELVAASMASATGDALTASASEFVYAIYFTGAASEYIVRGSPPPIAMGIVGLGICAGITMATVRFTESLAHGSGTIMFIAADSLHGMQRSVLDPDDVLPGASASEALALPGQFQKERFGLISSLLLGACDVTFGCAGAIFGAASEAASNLSEGRIVGAVDRALMRLTVQPVTSALGAVGTVLYGVAHSLETAKGGPVLHLVYTEISETVVAVQLVVKGERFV